MVLFYGEMNFEGYFGQILLKIAQVAKNSILIRNVTQLSLGYQEMATNET